MADLLQLGLDGRLLADEEDAGERLRGRTGRYRWLPSAPDALLFVRETPQGGPSSVPRVGLMGDLAFTGLPEVLEFLHQGRKTGTLHAVVPGGERGVIIQEGAVRNAFSDDPNDQLGEVLFKLGLVGRAALAKVEGVAGGRVGRALVDAGALSSHDLFKAVQYQVGEIVAAMLTAREGLFAFVDEPVEDRAFPGLQLNAQGLLMDAIRRIDEMAQFRVRLPSGKLYIARRKPAGPALDDEERRAYALCDGSHTLLEIARELRLGEFDTTKIIYHLLQGGYVQATAQPQPVAEPTHRDNPADVGRAFDTIVREIVAAVSRHGPVQEFVAAARGALANEAEGRSGFLNGVALGPAGELDVDALVRNLGPPGPEGRPGQARAVFTALSEVMFFLLFQAGELLSPAEDEALARRVKELLAAVEPG